MNYREQNKRPKKVLLYNAIVNETECYAAI